MEDVPVPEAGEENRERRGLRILSLDGGGIKGLASLLVLKYLMQSINAANPPKPCEVFDLIGGTSTGGLIAIMLGRLHMSVDEAIDAYLKFAPEVFEPKHRVNFLATAFNVSKAKGRCDSESLKEAIIGLIPADLGPPENALMFEPTRKCHSFVCAIRRENRSLVCFRSYPLEGSLDLQPKIWEAAMGTSAATTFYDPVNIGKFGQEFVDGGGGYNNPVQVAVDEAAKIWATNQRPIHLIVSVGTGKAALRGFGKNLKEVGETLIEMATETDKTWTQFANTHPQYPTEGEDQCAFRFQVEQGMEDVGMAEAKKIKEIAAATQRYMEEYGQAGTRGLQQFKKRFLESNKSKFPQSEVPALRSTIVPIDPEKVDYLMKYSGPLKIRFSTNVTKRAGTNWQDATISLPTKIFCQSNEFPIRQPDTLEEGLIWPQLLAQYNLKGEGDNLTQRIPVQKAPWCPDLGGAFAGEVALSELWRLIATDGNFYHHSSDTQREGIDSGNVVINIAGFLNHQPLIRLIRKPYTKKVRSDLGRPSVPSEALAISICGARGLAPNILRCDKKSIFTSSQPGWEYVGMPYALAFSLIEAQHRFFLPSHVKWLVEKAYYMLEVCMYLWDHADAFDCDENDVPVKITYEVFKSSAPTQDRASPLLYLGEHNSYRANALWEFSLRVLGSLTGPADVQTVEIEDTFNLLRDLKQPTHEDRVCSDTEGMNKIVQMWWNFYGPDRARWVALLLTTTLWMNLSECRTIPPEFETVLKHPSGKCYVI